MDRPGVLAAHRRPPGRPDRGLDHLPALDGYRGLAVAAVVLFHTEVITGGWLGVDVFFVLSGFLITRLLVHEGERDGRIDLPAFWRRRGRRLLPALVGVLVGVAVYAWWYPDPLRLPADLTTQMVGTIFYVANWVQLAAHHGYWDQYAAPSPLQHMWSLAIEEQFYLVYPVLMVGLAGATRRAARARRADPTGWVLAALTVGSWSLGVARLAAGQGFERVYLGTDTRIGAIGCGATLAWLAARPGGRERLLRWARPLNLPALAVVGAFLVVLDGARPWPAARWLLMPTFELAVGVLLVGALARGPGGPPANRLVTNRPLLWLGAISYGLYLWHIPVLLVVQRVLPTAPKPVWVTVTVVASLAVAEASYVLVEQPIRWRGLAVAPRPVLAVAAVALLVGSVAVTHRATGPARAAAAARPGDGAAQNLDAVAPDAPPATAPSADRPAALPLDRPDGRDARVLLVGDSLARDLSPAFDRVAPSLGVAPSEASYVGCGVGGMDVDRTPGAFNNPAYAAACDDWLATFGQMAATSRPDVVVLLRATARRTLPGTTERLDPCGGTYRSWYRRELRAEIDQLASAGAVVAVGTRPYARFGDVVDPDVDREVDCLNDEIRAVAAADPRAVVLPVQEWVCPDTEHRRCIRDVDGVRLRPDGLHFQQEGAEVATRWIVGQLYGP